MSSALPKQYFSQFEKHCFYYQHQKTPGQTIDKTEWMDEDNHYFHIVLYEHTLELMAGNLLKEVGYWELGSVKVKRFSWV